MFRVLLVGMAVLLLAGQPAIAEEAVYGSVELTGLARVTDWPLNKPGPSNTMVCNVNGPDGFLSIRSGPGTQHPANRKLNRLAIVEVDTRQRRGNWISVLTAYRTHDINGNRITLKELPVSGWAHDGYLCAFLD